MKVLEVFHAAPTPGFPLPFSPTIPLSFFDLFFYNFPPVQRLFLYKAPSVDCTTSAFLSTHLPNLKRSLSLALHRFYPLAGNLIFPEDGSLPIFSYSEGDSVSAVVAESDEDLDELVSNRPKQAQRFHSLVPSLPFDEKKQPLLSLQVTLFPEQGIGIGICVHHGVADGSSSAHFLKTWASLCRYGQDAAYFPPPIFDRDLIPDPTGLRELFWKQMNEFQMNHSMGSWLADAKPDMVRATFVVARAQLDALREKLRAKSSNRYSSFTLASAVVWVCLAKARRAPDGSQDGDVAAFGFVSNCRPRFHPPIPKEYFGNCLRINGAFTKIGEVIGGDAVAEASARIGEKVRDLEGGGTLKGAEEWMQMFRRDKPDAFKPEDVLSVAGSPNLRLYEVDFGWGRPAKVEVVTIDATAAMSLAENGDEGEGGIEVGLVLPMDLMDKFRRLFHATLYGDLPPVHDRTLSEA